MGFAIVEKGLNSSKLSDCDDDQIGATRKNASATFFISCLRCGALHLEREVEARL
jgi:hypothetical protein